MLATSKGTNADSDELQAPELAQESVVDVPLMLSTSVFPAGSNHCSNHNLVRPSSKVANITMLTCYTIRKVPPYRNT